MERFIGFYTSLPFWAGEKIDINSFCQYRYSPQREEIECKLSSLMSKEEFVYNTNEYTLKIYKDGMILLRIQEISNKLDEVYKNVNHKLLSSDKKYYINFLKEAFFEWSSYIKYLNCIYLLLDSCLLKAGIKYFQISEISSEDVFGIAFDNNEELGMKISHSAKTSIFQQLRRFPLLTYCNNHFLRFERKELPEFIFKSLNSELAAIYSKERIVKILAELTKSLGEYKIGNYPTSLVLSWFIIESFISDKWRKFLEDKNENITYIDEHGRKNDCKKIDSDRKSLLTGRDYTMSIILNILEINGILEFDTFRKIDKIRKMRNKIVHSDTNAPNNYDEKLRKSCQEAFNIITQFVGSEVGITLFLNLDSPINDLWIP